MWDPYNGTFRRPRRGSFTEASPVPSVHPGCSELVALWCHPVALMAQHRTALETIAPTINATLAQIAADIAGIEAFVAALEAGTPPTGADLVRTLRFLLRIAHARA